jgi:small subunit ribosomal protein S16
MLKIRLQRTGRKNEPTFRLVLTDSKNSAKSGRFLEVLGNYDSRRGEKAEFKSDRISHWMSVGAQVSDTVYNLLVEKKLISGKKLNKLPKKSAPVKEVVAEAPAPEVKAETAPAVETAPEVVEEAPATEEAAA